MISGQWLVHWTSDQEFRVPELVGSFFFTLSTQEYKWVCVSCQGNLTKCQGGSNLEKSNISSRESRNVIIVVKNKSTVV